MLLLAIAAAAIGAVAIVRAHRCDRDRRTRARANLARCVAQDRHARPASA